MQENSKQYWRGLFKKKREELSEKEIAEKSQRIAELFLTHFNEASYRWLHTFLPIEAKKEVDTKAIYSKWFTKSEDKKVLVPYVDNNMVMHSAVFEENTPLTTDKFGVSVPEPLVLFNDKPDLVIVPLICVDYQGNRVGYGKGCYDSFLAELPNVPKIGVSFYEPVEMISDIQMWDVPLDFCVTPNKVYNFNLY